MNVDVLDLFRGMEGDSSEARSQYLLDGIHLNERCDDDDEAYNNDVRRHSMLLM